MILKPTSTVIVIKSIPKEFKMMQCGVPSKMRAEAWAERNGHPLVYWYRRLERVYVLKNGRVG